MTDLQNYCFDLIEEIGKTYEEDNEVQLREKRQLGYKEEWTRDGKMENLPLPSPFKRRPRLGARLIMQEYLRRYLPAICNEIKDWIDGIRFH